MSEIVLTEEHLNKFLNSLSSKHRVNAGRYVKIFLEKARDSSRESLDDFFNNIKEKYKDSTIQYIWRVLHRFYVINNLEWPYSNFEAPTIRERTVFAPILDEEVIKDMIYAAKNDRLTARMTFYLAISTIYGCRCVELAGLSRQDVNIKDKLIYIATKKSGRERYHIIPDEIIPAISKYLPRLKPTNEKMLERIFRKIEEAISFPHIERVGWHSIRRSLNQKLMESSISEYMISDFLRWKRSDRIMTQRYARGTIIGRDTTKTGVSIQDKKIDDTIFSIHPFLKFWRGDE